MPNRWNRKFVRFVLFGSPLILAGCTSGSLTEGLFGPASDMVPLIPEQVGAATTAETETLGHAELMRLAQDLRSKGDAASAAHFYAKAHKANPDDVAALIGLGDMLAALGDSAQAADAYGQATTLQPGRPDAQMGLARASIALAQPQVAATQFQAVLSANDQDVRAYNGLGVAADMMGDHKAAQEHYRAGLAIDPQNIALLNNFGLSLALSGDFDNGIFMLEELAAAPDASPTTRQNLALAYGLAGRDQEAEKVARVDLDDAAIRKNMAFIASHRGGDGNSTELAKALKVELTSVQIASQPAVVPPSQVAELAQAATTTTTETAAAETDSADGWYYEEPVIEPAPTVAVAAEALPAPQLAQSSEVATARGMRGLSGAGTMAGVALAALPRPAAQPDPEEDLPSEPAMTVIDLPMQEPVAAEETDDSEEPIIEVVAVDHVDGGEPAIEVAELPDVPVIDLAVEAPAPETPVAEIPAAEVPAAEPVVVTQVARALPVKAGAVPRAMLAMPVAATMSNAPDADAATAAEVVTVYDAVPAAAYCRDADVGAVNCLAGLASGAATVSGAFSFGLN